MFKFRLSESLSLKQICRKTKHIYDFST